MIWKIEPPVISTEPPSFPLPKVEEEVKGKDNKADPKKAPPPKPAAGKDKPKEEEQVPKINEGPKYKFGKMKKVDGE